MTNTEIIEQYFLDYSKRLSNNTIKTLRINFASLFNFAKKNINEITYRDLKNWQNALKQRGLKASSINAKTICIKILFRYCYEEGLIQDNPAGLLSSIKLEKKLPRFLGMKELHLMMEITKGDTMYRTIIELLFATGMRAEELVQIKVKHIDWERKAIFIPKSKNNIIAYVPFSSRVEVWLKKYLTERVDSDSEFLFIRKDGTPLNRYSLYHTLKRYGIKAGIPFKVGPHFYRRTCATYCMAKGASTEFIMKLLRLNKRNTLNSYVNLSYIAKKEFEGVV